MLLQPKTHVSVSLWIDLESNCFLTSNCNQQFTWTRTRDLRGLSMIHNCPKYDKHHVFLEMMLYDQSASGSWDKLVNKTESNKQHYSVIRMLHHPILPDKLLGHLTFTFVCYLVNCTLCISQARLCLRNTSTLASSRIRNSQHWYSSWGTWHKFTVFLASTSFILQV